MNVHARPFEGRGRRRRPNFVPDYQFAVAATCRWSSVAASPRRERVRGWGRLRARRFLRPASSRSPRRRQWSRALQRRASVVAVRPRGRSSRPRAATSRARGCARGGSSARVARGLSMWPATCTTARSGPAAAAAAAAAAAGSPAAVGASDGSRRAAGRCRCGATGGRRVRAPSLSTAHDPAATPATPPSLATRAV